MKQAQELKSLCTLVALTVFSCAVSCSPVANAPAPAHAPPAIAASPAHAASATETTPRAESTGPSGSTAPASVAPSSTATSSADCPAPAPATAPPIQLEGVKHHALPQTTLGFYGVLLPEGYETGKDRYPLVVILHGSGSTEEAHGKLSSDFGREGVIYLLPRALHPHHEVFMDQKVPGWTAWPAYPAAWGKYNDPDFPKEELKNADPRAQYVEWIAQTIKDVRKRYRISNDRAVVFGHSQGAAFAHDLAITHPELVKGYLAYAGYYATTTDAMDDARAAKALKRHKVTVSIAHYEGDTSVKVDESRRLVDYFKKHGVQHEAHIMPDGSHGASPELRSLARTFLRRECCGDSATDTTKAD